MRLSDSTIINADDLGISVAVNDAIFDGFDRSIVSSATLLANGPAVDHACAGLRSRPRLGVGVHLNTSEFAPLTEPFRQLRLDHPDLDLRTTRTLGRHQLRTIGDEWLAQIERVRAAGVEPTHLDSHHFDHVNPLLLHQLRRVAHESGIRRVRGMHNLSQPKRPRAIRTAKAAHRIALRRAGLTTTAYMTDATTWLGLARAGELPTDGVCEVMAHPGHPDYADETRALLAADELLSDRPISWASVPWLHH